MDVIFLMELWWSSVLLAIKEGGLHIDTKELQMLHPVGRERVSSSLQSRSGALYRGLSMHMEKM